MTAIVIDAGGFIAWERGSQSIRARLEAARRLGLPLVTASPVIAQVWRDGARQALLSVLLRAVEVNAPGLAEAQAAGVLCRETRTTDVVDALLVVTAGNGATILTSDRDDIAVLVVASGRRIDVVNV